MSTPGAVMSTTSSDNPRGPDVPGSLRARHSPQRANCAYEVHTFWPLTTQPAAGRRVGVGSRPGSTAPTGPSPLPAR